MRVASAIDEPSALALLEEAFHLLRRTPRGLAVYLAGAVPFVLGALWFWSDMSRGAMARQRCSAAALALTALYLWKRTLHARFGAHLRAAAADRDAPPWWWRDWMAALGVQARCATWSLLALPIALLILLPFGWLYAYHQNLAAVCEQPSADAGDARRRAWAAAQLWPRQNHLALSLLLLAGVVVLINIAVTLLLAPTLTKALFGVELSYAMSDTWMLNGTCVAVVLAATHLAMDAPVKAAYALRVFHGEARRTGLDLRVEWRRLKMAAGAALLAAVVLAPARATAGDDPSRGAEMRASGEERAAEERLDAAIEWVLARPEFAWRLPRDATPSRGESASLLERALRAVADGIRWVGRQIEALWDWIDRVLRRWMAGDRGGPDRQGADGLAGPVKAIALAIAAALGAIAAWAIARHLRRRRRRVDAEAAPAPMAADAAAVDSESVLATSRPGDEWMALAGRFGEAGDWRRAVRAAYLAVLAVLAELRWVEVAPARSNREYLRDLAHRATADVRDGFADCVRLFEQRWYGDHPAGPADVDRLRAALERFRAPLAP